MMLKNHMLRLLMATALVLGAAGAHALSQEEIAALPDAGDVVSAYMKARHWVTEFQAPSLEDSQSQVELRGATAALIILRSAGRVVGTGVGRTADQHMLRRAGGAALSAPSPSVSSPRSFARSSISSAT